MVVKLFGATLSGAEPHIIEVEVDITRSVLPAFNIVGLPDTAIKESKERIRNAIINSNFSFPTDRITVNLAPADLKKEGSHLELAIALGIIFSLENYSVKLDNFCVLGELSLDGEVRSIRGILPIVMLLKEKGIKNIILPVENSESASIISGINIFPVKNFKETYLFLKGEYKIKSVYKKLDRNIFFNYPEELDFSEVKGQIFAKKALEVAAAGGHNVLMIGSPGAGKTMLAKRLPTILPPLTFEEALETSKIYSLAGLLNRDFPIVTMRPFRAPHHTVSEIALIGGGSNPKPGEVSLAHNGVLFLDELLEFNRKVLEVLREPLENGKVRISRIMKSVEFPARFMLVAAMNPCPCGNFGDKTKQCSCTPYQIQRYLNKLSQPLLDRIDIHLRIQSLTIGEITQKKSEESSKNIRERVIAARKIQQKRFAGTNIYCNAQMTNKMVDEFCQIDSDAQRYLENILETKGLSARAYFKILKIARTIADLYGEKRITKSHIAQSCQYRILDRRENLFYE